VFIYVGSKCGEPRESEHEHSKPARDDLKRAAINAMMRDVRRALDEERPRFNPPMKERTKVVES
jgi:hypothetical protein